MACDGFVNPSLILFAKIATRVTYRQSKFRHGRDRMGWCGKFEVAAVSSEWRNA
jgi:hypothetical protein